MIFYPSVQSRFQPKQNEKLGMLVSLECVEEFNRTVSVVGSLLLDFD